LSYSDNLENNLKALESREESDPAAAQRNRAHRELEKAKALAAAPYADKLKSGAYTSGLLEHTARIAHGLRTKVQITWIANSLRLQARDYRLELHPSATGVVAHMSKGFDEIGEEPVDLDGDPSILAAKWLAIVGPRPVEPPIEDLDE
jgi:hypothetical protein